MRAVQMLPRTGMLLGLALAGLTVAVEAARAQSPMGGYQTPQEREIYNTVPGNRDSGSPIEATNPMDLMNRLRQATSMNDATDPADAIDAALKGYATENPAVGPSMRP